MLVVTAWCRTAPHPQRQQGAGFWLDHKQYFLFSRFVSSCVFDRSIDRPDLPIPIIHAILSRTDSSPCLAGFFFLSFSPLFSRIDRIIVALPCLHATKTNQPPRRAGYMEPRYDPYGPPMPGQPWGPGVPGRGAGREGPAQGGPRGPPGG